MKGFTQNRIGHLRFDPKRCQLFNGRTPIPLQAQPGRVLGLLVSRAGDVVTREEIRTHVWCGTTVAFDQSINYCIRQIRIALGCEAHLLETLPREGYRLLTSGAARTPWNLLRLRVVERVAIPLIAGLMLGFGLATAFDRTVRPQPVRPGEWLIVVSNLLDHADVMYKEVRDHLTGEANCPYMRFLTLNSSRTHQSS